MKPTGPTNPVTRKIVEELKKAGTEKKAKLWPDIARRVEKPRRNRPAVNLSRLSRHTKANDTVIVPGKVLSSGVLKHKLTVAALEFSSKAREEINKSGKAVSIPDLVKLNPSGKKVKIIK